MRTYELVVLIHPDLEIDVDTPVSKIEQLVENAGGKVIKRDNWGKKRLAYRIKHQDFAIYVYLELQLEGTNVTKFENSLLLTEEVIRHLLVAKETANAKPESKSKPATKSAAKSKKEEVKEENGDGKEL